MEQIIPVEERVTPLLSFIVVDSRSDVHPDWVEQCIHSLQNLEFQDYEVVVVNNLGRPMTIGKAFNEGVKAAKGRWCVFVGDDDLVEADYASVLARFIKYAEENNPKIVNVATYMTAFEEETGHHIFLSRQSTGAFPREYLLKYPFNETLLKGIDREYIEEVQKRNDLLLIVKYYCGYYYRRHQDYRCAGDLLFHSKPSDLYFVSTNRFFLSPITDRLAQSAEVFVDSSFNYELASKAKVAWMEWANDKAIEMSNTNLPGVFKVLRIHAFEAFTEYAYKINWNGFDAVIFIDRYIKDYVEKQFGKVNGAVIIPNGVDMKKFRLYPDKKRNNKVAFAGYLSRKKGIGELMLIAKSFPEYEFHVAGRYQENDICDWILEKCPDNVFIHPWQYDIQLWYPDMTYVINTSMRESQGMSLMEGMACGLKPIVSDWIGAEEIYGSEYVYKNIEDIRRMLEGDYTPEKYREFVEKNYNFEDMYKRIEDLLLAERISNG